MLSGKFWQRCYFSTMNTWHGGIFQLRCFGNGTMDGDVVALGPTRMSVVLKYSHVKTSQCHNIPFTVPKYLQAKICTETKYACAGTSTVPKNTHAKTSRVPKFLALQLLTPYLYLHPQYFIAQ